MGVGDQSLGQEGNAAAPGDEGGAAGRSRRLREPLSRERIEIAALALIEREGLAAFSIRKLGQVLGCEAMSIYHYFPSKAHIMDALVDHIIAEMFPIAPADLPWEERLRRTARQWRDLLKKRPSLFTFVATHRLNTRLGLRWINEMLKMCAAAGLTREQTVRMFRTFGYYLNGAILDETAGYARGPSTVEPVPDDEVARDYPEVIAAGPYFRESEWDKTFDFGVELLIEGYARLAKENRRHPA
jgi:AcrR family transcriptional regulator